MRKVFTLVSFLVAIAIAGYFVPKVDASHQHTLNLGNQAEITLANVENADRWSITGLAAVTRVQNFTQGMFILNVTDTPLIAEAAGDGFVSELEVWVQTSPDNGTTWTDVVKFDTVNAGSNPDDHITYAAPQGVGKQIAIWNSNVDDESEAVDVFVPNATSIADGTVRNIPLGNQLRVAYSATGATRAWDFTVVALLRN